METLGTTSFLGSSPASSSFWQTATKDRCCGSSYGFVLRFIYVCVYIYMYIYIYVYIYICIYIYIYIINKYHEFRRVGFPQLSF